MLAVVVLSYFVGVGLGRAQEPQLSVAIHQVDDSAYPEVRLVTTVTDATGRSVTDLARSQFAVMAGESQAPVESAQTVLDAGVGVDIVLALDVSGSMEGAPLARAKEVSRQLVQQLGPSDTVAVAAFSDDVTVVLDYTADKVAAVAAINSLALGGDTALYAAVAKVSDMALNSSQGRRAVILLSDGRDTASPASLSPGRSVEAAASSGVPFFTIGLGDDIDEAYLEQLGSVTEAVFYQAPSPDDLPALFNSIGVLLRTQYVLTIDGRNIALEAETLSVTVRDEGRTGSGERPLPGDLFRPRIDLSALPAEPIGEPLSLQPRFDARRDIESVQYFAGETLLAEATEEPFALPLDPIDFAAGALELRIVATDTANQQAEALAPLQIAQVSPRITIRNAKSGDVITGRFTLQVEVESQAPPVGVEASLGGVPLPANEDGSYTIAVEEIGAGSATLIVKATDAAGAVTETPPMALELREAPGGASPVLPIAVVVGVAAVLAAAALWYARRRDAGGEPAALPDGPAPAPAAASLPPPAADEPSQSAAADARLTLIDAGNGSRVYALAREPVTIGSDPGCDIIVTDPGGQIAPREFRGWLREDRLMLHRLAARGGNADKTPVWAVLDSGDEFQVGRYRIIFELAEAS